MAIKRRRKRKPGRKRLTNAELRRQINAYYKQAEMMVRTTKQNVEAAGFSSGAIKTVLAKIETLTGKKGTRGKVFAKGNISRMNKEQLLAFRDIFKSITQSPWFSEEGRDRLLASRQEAFRLKGYNMDEEDLYNLGKLMDNENIHKLYENKILGSDELINMSQDNEKAQAFITALQELGDEDAGYEIATNDAAAFDDYDKIIWISEHLNDPDFAYIKEDFWRWREMSASEMDQILELYKVGSDNWTDKDLDLVEEFEFYYN